MIETQEIREARRTLQGLDRLPWPSRLSTYLGGERYSSLAHLVSIYDGPTAGRIIYDIAVATGAGLGQQNDAITERVMENRRRWGRHAYASQPLDTDSSSEYAAVLREVFKESGEKEPSFIDEAGVFAVAASQGLITLSTAAKQCGVYTRHRGALTGAVKLTQADIGTMSGNLQAGLELFTGAVASQPPVLQ